MVDNHKANIIGRNLLPRIGIILIQEKQTHRVLNVQRNDKKINKYIHKNKYQMPNIDLLLDNIAQVVKSDKSNQTLFSTLDLRYAYSQIPLDKAAREQCNFSLIGGNTTGIYQFQTGFYFLTDMPAEFQKAVDLTLTNCNNTYAYLDDILIVTKGTIETHRQKIQTALTKLDKENLAIFLDKRKFTCKQIEWLGFDINSEATKPLTKKTEAIEKL